MVVKSEADSLIDGILGQANPGESGTDDLGGAETENNDDDDDGSNQDVDEPDEHANQDDDDDGDDDDQDDDDDSDDGDEANGDDPLAREARDDRRPQREDKNARHDAFDPMAKLQTDKKGAIYLNGKLVANAGKEARIYMEWRKVARADREHAIKVSAQLGKLAQSAQGLLKEHQALKEQKTLFDRANLTAEEQNQMLELALAFKKDPLQGVKLFLTRAHLSGVDITKLGAGGGIDAKVLMEDLKGSMTELLKPVLTQTSERAKQEEVRSQAEGFFDRNPAAADVSRVVGGAHRLANILKQSMAAAPDLTMDELFERLHYQLLKDGKMTTAPVAQRRSKVPRAAKRNLENNFRRTVSRDKPGTIPSWDDISRGVLADIAAAEHRGQ